MRTASTNAASAGSVSARGLRVAALRGAVGVRGRIPSGTPKDGVDDGTDKATTSPARAGSEPGRRAAALRSLVGTPGRTSRDARSAA
ncbi:hypothetical protein ACKI14_00640 [Streptomyces turgidiscabies]|uniref:Uncharacterized protein n=1 Tax=Streptomyces turgidiscabies (strain Car8) TaxID=698760 RepID=L7FIG4_STRT8|nr:hypothetical protein STRTUCAR8_08978 [Streptomyces turgidiscabies Car8]GAQ77036.1 hypothetical protein T45_08848 [Streptomyces turgidiscabies]